MDFKWALILTVAVTITTSYAKPTPEEVLRGVFITDEALKRLQDKAQQNDNQRLSNTPIAASVISPTDQNLVRTNVPYQTTQTQAAVVSQQPTTNQQVVGNQQPVVLSLQPSQPTQQTVVVNQPTGTIQQTSPNSQQPYFTLQQATPNQQSVLLNQQPAVTNQQTLSTNQQPILVNVQPNTSNQQGTTNNQQPVYVTLQPAPSNQQAVLLNQQPGLVSQQTVATNQRPVLVTLQTTTNQQPITSNQQPVLIQQATPGQGTILVGQQSGQIVGNIGQPAYVTAQINGNQATIIGRPSNTPQNQGTMYALVPVNTQNTVQGTNLGGNTVYVPVQ